MEMESGFDKRRAPTFTRARVSWLDWLALQLLRLSLCTPLGGKQDKFCFGAENMDASLQ
jgi:hypothetical protein